MRTVKKIHALAAAVCAVAAAAAAGPSFTPADGAGVSSMLLGHGIGEINFLGSPEQNTVGIVRNLDEPAIPFTNGVYLSTGKIADVVGDNEAVSGTTKELGTAWSIAADRQLRQALVDGGLVRSLNNMGDSSGFIMRIRPDYRTLNVSYAFLSEEYYRKGGNFDTFAILVSTNFMSGVTNWVNITTFFDPDFGEMVDAGIESISPDSNADRFVSNVITNDYGETDTSRLPYSYPDIPLKLNCNGAIISTTPSMVVEPGQELLVAPVIADCATSGAAQINSLDSHLLLNEFGITSGADISVAMAANSATSNLVVTIKNVGPIPATGIVWTNALPAGLTLVSMAPIASGTSIGTGTNAYDVGDLAVGASRSYTLQVAPEEPGTYLCRAEAWPWEGDFNPGDNVATATLDFGAAEPRADLSVTVAPLYAEVQWNDGNRTNVITVTVVNNGPDAAENVAVTVSNILPSVTLTVPAMTIQSLAGGESRAYTVATRATPATAGIDTFFASATTTTADTDESNNLAQADVFYPAYTDVTVALAFDEPVYGLRGGRIRVVTANAGPSPVQGLQTQVSFGNDDSEFRNDLPAGGCVTNWVEFGPVTPLGAAAVNATAIVSAATGAEDIDPGNDAADAAAPVVWPDLSVELSATPDPVESEGTVTYVASLACAGDGVTNAAVKITLPANRVAVSDEVPAGFTADGADAYVLSGISINAGATNSWTITVKAPLTMIDATLDAAFETVPVPDWDATPGNNAVQVETALNRASQADLSVTVAPVAAVVEWNDGNRTNVIHVAIENNGPDEASVSSFSASNTLTGVTFQLPALGNPRLASGASLEFDIPTSAFPAIMGTDVFTARVSGSLPDPDADNNVASCEVLYPPYCDLAVGIAFEEPVYGLRENRVIVLSGNNGPLEVTNAVTTLSCQGQNYVVTNSLAAGAVATNRIAIGQVATLGAAAIDATAGISIPRAAASPAQTGSQIIDFNAANDMVDASASVIWPDIAVAISDSPDPVAAGGTVAYAVSAACTNDAASNITVRVTLPSNRVAGEDVVPAGFAADGADDYVLSGLALDSGASANWSFSVKAPSPDDDSTMTAKVATDPVPDWDATPANNGATTDTAVSQRIRADVGVAITNALDIVEWNGGNRTNVLSVYVSNNGPSPAECVAVVVSNTLSGVTFTLPPMPAGALAKGQTIVLAIPTRALPETTGTDLYRAVVSSATEDDDGSNNAATCEVQYPGFADVGVAISFVEPVYGFRTNYIEAVSFNNGPLDVTNAVADIVCQGVSYSVTNDLAAGATVTNRIEIGEVSSVGAATISAEAAIALPAGAVTDPDSANNTASAQANVVWPDVAVTLMASPNPVDAGGTVTFIASASVSDGRGEGLSFSMTLPDGSTETVSGINLPDGGSSNWVFTADAPVSNTDSTMTGTFALSPVPAWDAIAANNSATASVTASARVYADVAAYAAWDGEGALPGSQNGKYTFRAAVSNLSTVAAENVTVSLVLTTNDCEWVAQEGWTLSGTTLSLDAVIASLPPGAATNFEATARLSGRATQIKAQTVVAAQDDPNAANNTATATRGIGWPDLRVLMLPSATSVVEGQEFTCEIFVLNIGGVPVRGVALTNVWSADSANVSLSVKAAGAKVSGRKAVFAGLNLAAGSSTSLVAKVSVTSMPADNSRHTLTGTAACAVPYGDLTPDDNRASCTVTVSPYSVKINSVKWFLSANSTISYAQISIKNTGIHQVKSLWFAMKDQAFTINGKKYDTYLIDPNFYKANDPGTKEKSASKTMPDGCRFLDLTSAMKAAVMAVGNKDANWDPGETILIGVSKDTEAAYKKGNGYGSVNYDSEKVIGIRVAEARTAGGSPFVVSSAAFTPGYRCGPMFHPCDKDKDFHISNDEYNSALANLKSRTELPRDKTSADPNGAYPQFDSPEAEFLFVSEAYWAESSSKAKGYFWSMENQQWRIFYK